MSTCSTNTAFTHATLPARLAIVTLIGMALAARKQRNILKTLEEDALYDIGLSRAEAQAEADKPIWDVPASWRRQGK